MDFVKKIIVYYPCIKPITIVLKQIIQKGGLNNTYQGGLSSYSLLLMLLGYV